MYTEEQKRELWTKTLNENNVYISGIKFNKENQDDTDYRKIFYNTLKTTRESNEKTGFGTNKTVNYKYIITEIMKLKQNEIINYDKNKLVKAIERRKIKTIKRYQEEPKDNINLHKIKLEQNKKEDTKELNKAMFIDTIILREYIGTTTENQRKRNKEIEEAENQGLIS